MEVKHKELGVLRSASRNCGLSYRSACNRGIEMVRGLQEQGFLYMYDTNRNLGRFVFRTTEKGNEVLSDN